MIDEEFLEMVLPKAERKVLAAITVRGIGQDIHQCSEAVMLPLYFPGYKDGKAAIALVERPARIVKNLRAGMLCGMDIMGAEQMEISIHARQLMIGSCPGFKTTLKVTPGKTKVDAVVQSKAKVVIPPKSTL